MKKQITFEDESYSRDTKALEWLLNLSKCFVIRSVKLRSYVKETKYTRRYCTQVEVRYD